MTKLVLAVEGRVNSVTATVKGCKTDRETIELDGCHWLSGEKEGVDHYHPAFKMTVYVDYPSSFGVLKAGDYVAVDIHKRSSANDTFVRGATN